MAIAEHQLVLLDEANLDYDIKKNMIKYQTNSNALKICLFQLGQLQDLSELIGRADAACVLFIDGWGQTFMDDQMT